MESEREKARVAVQINARIIKEERVLNINLLEYDREKSRFREEKALALNANLLKSDREKSRAIEEKALAKVRDERAKFRYERALAFTARKNIKDDAKRKLTDTLDNQASVTVKMNSLQKIAKTSSQIALKKQEVAATCHRTDVETVLANGKLRDDLE